MELIWWNSSGGNRLVELVWWKSSGGNRLVEVVWWKSSGGTRLVELVLLNPPGRTHSIKTNNFSKKCSSGTAAVRSLWWGGTAAVQSLWWGGTVAVRSLWWCSTVGVKIEHTYILRLTKGHVNKKIFAHIPIRMQKTLHRLIVVLHNNNS